MKFEGQPGIPIILATWEAEIMVQGKKFMRLFAHLQDNHSKMDWRCGSSLGAPALQVQISEFKPHSHQNKIF
jgi:hypothetical protein